ncbi:transcriptional regulator [Actinoallomurus iriomotensis]|uniref:Transcriptional regulator n=2 Tax=Actinoallomurus iriomotensis TaxID=478107 RepID=A0A9W6VXV0_9ACTN|nr:transcriptional regulator [Actinoallomurus iriomotensis]
MVTPRRAAMLRIHFGTEDLARTRIADTADAMWEIVSSLHRLQTRSGRVAFTGWLNQARDDLRQRELLRTVQHLLLPLAPRAAYFPDFLTPPQGLLGVEPGVEAVLATPRRRVRRELARLQTQQGRSVWARGLADGDGEIRTTVGRALHAYHRAAVAPHWPLIEASVATDRAVRIRALQAGGVHALLESFAPMMRWRSPVLEVQHPADRSIHLDGRGLLLIPSYFCWRIPVALADPLLAPTMIYPIAPELRRWDTIEPCPDHVIEPTLIRLLGTTRARVLQEARYTRSTTEIGRAVHVSAASVSQHAAVLRAAGLIESRRHGGAVLHSLTTLGRALLAGRVLPPPENAWQTVSQGTSRSRSPSPW